jgi:hypothetical protein
MKLRYSWGLSRRRVFARTTPRDRGLALESKSSAFSGRPVYSRKKRHFAFTEIQPQRMSDKTHYVN